MLIGEWVVESKKYSEGRGRTTVRPTEDGKFLRLESSEEDQRFPIAGQWEMSRDGSRWEVDFDLIDTNVRD